MWPDWQNWLNQPKLSGHAPGILDEQTVESDHTTWEVQQQH